MSSMFFLTLAIDPEIQHNHCTKFEGDQIKEITNQTIVGESKQTQLKYQITCKRIALICILTVYNLHEGFENMAGMDINIPP